MNKDIENRLKEYGEFEKNIDNIGKRTNRKNKKCLECS